MKLKTQGGDEKYIHKILAPKPKAKRAFCIPKRSWQDNIKHNFKEIWYVVVDRSYVSQDRDQ
jgi:hypothetical protein